MKPVRFTLHAREQCEERGADESEVIRAIQHGVRESAKYGREMCRLNVEFHAEWQGRFYAIKQVAPVIVEEPGEVIVVTVYTFYF